jgi:hypothetical protein
MPAIPPPNAGDTQQGIGPGPGGGYSSPAPAQQDPGAAQAVQMSLEIVKNARMLAQKFPQISSEVRQINDLVSQMQGKIKGQGPQAETAAPPM